MITVLSCIATEHDPWLVALAALIASLGSYTAVRMYTMALAARGVLKLAWVFLTSLVVATGAWTTHFVAMLARLAEAPVTYDPALTLLSLLAAVCGANLALTIAGLDRKGVWPAIGGGVLGLGIAVMHYFGVLAYRIDGIVRWDGRYVVISVALAMALGSLALAVARGQLGDRLRPHAATGALVAAILSLHFTGVAAMEVVPLAASSPSLSEGAQTLAVATALASLLILVAGVLAYFVDREARRAAGEEAERLVRTDSLTGLPNRDAATADLFDRVARADSDERLGVMAIEVASIDAISQRHGARVADLVLQAIANRLSEAARPGVSLARTGSARFFGLDSIANREEAGWRARRLHAALSRPLLIESVEIDVDLRMGIAVFPDDASDGDGLIRKVQAALTRAKVDPLAPIAFHDELAHASVQRGLRLAHDLRGAVARGELDICYQPQVSIADGLVIGYEALLRWRHADLGMISPDEFIPLAERSGLIVDIGTWVLRKACAEAASWPDEVRLAVNVSPVQLRRPDFAETILEALLASGLPPHRLEIELTETLLIDDRPQALRALRRIRMLGVRLALDDFGTGYSSMDVLRRFPFDRVKLDKTFVDELESSVAARAMLHAMLVLGRKLGIAILVEGVETHRQLDILREEGCREAQGFFLGRPVLPAQIHETSGRRLAC